MKAEPYCSFQNFKAPFLWQLFPTMRKSPKTHLGFRGFFNEQKSGDLADFTTDALIFKAKLQSFLSL